MTNKEIAERIDIAMGSTEYDGHGGVFQQLRALRNELDPPLPGPGTVVWWQDIDGLSEPKLGMVNMRGRIEIFGSLTELEPHQVSWKPARFLAPNEVAVEVPSTDDWPPKIHAIVKQWQVAPTDTDVIITRAEAEKMQTFYDFDKEVENEQ